MSEQTSESSSPDGGVEIEDVIQAFLQEHDYLHEFRLQKLIYLAELVHGQLEENRLVEDVEYKPYMYGSYSEDVSDKLEDLDDELESLPDYQHGKMTKRYIASDESLGSIEDEIAKEIIKAVSDVTSSKRSVDLEKWSKSTSLYEETPYDQPMNFEDMDTEDFVEDVLNEFPELEEKFSELGNKENT